MPSESTPGAPSSTSRNKSRGIVLGARKEAGKKRMLPRGTAARVRARRVEDLQRPGGDGDSCPPVDVSPLQRSQISLSRPLYLTSLSHPTPEGAGKPQLLGRENVNVKILRMRNSPPPHTLGSPGWVRPKQGLENKLKLDKSLKFLKTLDMNGVM